MRINTISCLVLALVGCISGLTIRFRDPSRNAALPRRRTLTGWRSSGWASEGQRRRLIRLNNIWSQYRFPSHGSWPYSDVIGLNDFDTSTPWRQRISRPRDTNAFSSLGSTGARVGDRSPSTGLQSRDRSSLYEKYGSLADYLPLPVGEKFKSSPIKDPRSNRDPLPSGPLAPEISRMREEVKAKVESGYYGQKPLYDFL